MSAAYSLDSGVLGANRISFLMGLAPERISRTLFRRLHIERNKFVGSSKGKKKGSFTRSVMRRRRRGRPGTMPINVAAMFRGFVKVRNEKSVEGASLKMGILPKNPKGFVRGIMDLQRGFTRSSSKYMPLPVYDNLAKLGITRAFTRSFHLMANSGELVTLQSGGNVLFISQDLIDQGSDIYEATIFFGSKRTNVRANNFGFIKQWNTRWPKVRKRMQNAINREVRSMNTGRVKAK